MRNGGIGKGWYEDAIENKDIPIHNEFSILAKTMLKQKLKEVFEIISDKHRGDYA